jgi:hypothetical protein
LNNPGEVSPVTRREQCWGGKVRLPLAHQFTDSNVHDCHKNVIKTLIKVINDGAASPAKRKEKQRALEPSTTGAATLVLRYPFFWARHDYLALPKLLCTPLSTGVPLTSARFSQPSLKMKMHESARHTYPFLGYHMRRSARTLHL